MQRAQPHLQGRSTGSMPEGFKIGLEEEQGGPGAPAPVGPSGSRSAHAGAPTTASDTYRRKGDSSPMHTSEKEEIADTKNSHFSISPISTFAYFPHSPIPLLPIPFICTSSHLHILTFSNSHIPLSNAILTPTLPYMAHIFRTFYFGTPFASITPHAVHRSLHHQRRQRNT